MMSRIAFGFSLLAAIQDKTWPSEKPLPASFEFPPYVILQNDTTAVVSWRTASDTAGAVEYGATTTYGRTRASPTATRQHAVTIDKLSRNTRYFYRVRVDTDSAEGTFTTPGAAAFRFAHFGEFHAPRGSDRYGPKRAFGAKTFSNVLRSFEPHFIIESGDLFDSFSHQKAAAQRFPDVVSYMTASKSWISNLFILPCFSNHTTWNNGDNDITLYFPLPDGKRSWYSTRYGGVEILTLNSQEDEDLRRADVAAQKEWLIKKVRESHDGVDDPLFLVCAWHSPAWSSADSHRQKERDWVTANFVDVVDQNGGADLVLVGHDKISEVSAKPYPDGRTMWHVQTSIGDFEYENLEGANPYSKFKKTDGPTVLLVEVNGAALSARVSDNAGRTLYSFEIKKRTR